MWMSTWTGSSNHQLNTPLNDPSDEPTAHEIEVVDPTHPLFGRRFPVLSVHDSLRSVGHVFVSYRGYMSLRLELSATDLAASPRLAPPATTTKLTSQALTELAQLAEQCEVLHALLPTQRCLGRTLPGTPKSSRGRDGNRSRGGGRIWEIHSAKLSSVAHAAISLARSCTSSSPL